MTTHIVQPGETLGAIAKKYLGKASAYMVIANANGIADPNRISVGAELIIPDDQIVTEQPSEPGSSPAPVMAAGGGQLNLSQLQSILQTSDPAKAELYLDGLNQCFSRYQIDTPLRMAHFLAQVCHESNNFKAVSENLNYSAKALCGVFGKYFPTEELADSYARQPEKIANRIYASRMGNGDEQSGEGWAYRGRGLMQLTGKDNYQAFSDAYGENVISNPDQVADNPQLCVAVAGWYWDSRKLNQYADDDDIKTITKKINGGYHGLDDRQAKLDNAKEVLATS